MNRITNKDLKIIVIIIVGVCISFAFIYFAYYHDFCPCSDDNVPISVGCIMRFPEKYSDKYVQVLGKYNSGNENWNISSEKGNYEVKIYGTIYGSSASFGDVPVHLSFSIVNGTSISNLIEWKEYYWYGIFRFTDNVDEGDGVFYLKGMFLEVSKIEEV
jgi:hypothetical protein